MFVSNYPLPDFLEHHLLHVGYHLPPVLGYLVRIGCKKEQAITCPIKTDKRSPLYCDWHLCARSDLSSVCNCNRNLHIWNPEEEENVENFSSQVADSVVWMGPPAEFAILVGSKMSTSTARDLLNSDRRRQVCTAKYMAPLLCLRTWLGSCCELICCGRSAKVLQLIRDQITCPIRWLLLKIRCGLYHYFYFSHSRF